MKKEDILKILEGAKDKNSDVPMRLVRQAFEKLPEPCTDTISRQDAIDEIDEWIKAFLENGHKGSAADARLIKNGIIRLPSAQSEIIHCEDCKHRDPEDKKCDCGHDILWQLPRRDDWYCADAERRIDG